MLANIRVLNQCCVVIFFFFFDMRQISISLFESLCIESFVCLFFIISALHNPLSV